MTRHGYQEISQRGIKGATFAHQVSVLYFSLISLLGLQPIYPSLRQWMRTWELESGVSRSCSTPRRGKTWTRLREIGCYGKSSMVERCDRTVILFLLGRSRSPLLNDFVGAKSARTFSLLSSDSRLVGHAPLSSAIFPDVFPRCCSFFPWRFLWIAWVSAVRVRACCPHLCKKNTGL